ncbi:outer membrane protein transport protein [Photobacterium sp. SDRW27]|uniref:outer membrane protein transport protein n=1 Tax=Photobacterium obscurum TaxID=2829490 RepID=UPI002243646C|nr:outer membrane protein transport protein [Photobacterium obscurum]MCW8328355.1 outer membrane protein transport protein [Photobacterium obscurum]
MSKKITLTAIAVAAALMSINANAAGYQVNEHSASGLGRAFAGEAAIADNASVLARNPAAMTRFKTAELSLGLSIVDPSIDVKDNDFNSENNDIGQTAKDVAPLAFVPAGYYIHPINERFSAGLALFSSYGVATEYPADFNNGSAAGMTSLITFNVNPNFAYRINDHFSIGGGFSLVYGDAELERYYGSWANAGGNPSDKTIRMEGDTFGWGWNLGALYEINEDHRFGLSYRSQVDLDFEGDFTDYSGSITGTPGSVNVVTGELDVVLPAIAEFSGYHALNKQWAVHYSVQWIQYSKFEELRATSNECNPGYEGNAGVCLLKEEDYDDNFRYSIGATYTLSPEWTLRAGFAFDEQAGKSTLSIPDTDRYWYSAGATYTHSQDISIDLGFTYLDGKETTFDEDGNSFTSSGGAIISAAQINYKF